MLADRPVAVFLDYDGTLTPIVDRPQDALLAPDAAAELAALAGVCTVGIISGRDLDDVAALVDLEGLWLAGSHGFDVVAPDGTRHQFEQGTAALPALDAAELALAAAIELAPGAWVERKRFAIAVHHRAAADHDVPELERAVGAIADADPALRMTGGKKIFELRPAADWDKGKALRWLCDAAGGTVGRAGGVHRRRRDRRGRTGRGPPTRARRGRRDRGPFVRRARPGGRHVAGRRAAAAAPCGGGRGMNEWTWTYEGYVAAEERQREALCTLGNGYLATRGALAELGADDQHSPGTYVAGVFNRLSSEVAGRTVTNESIVNVPNWLLLRCRVPGGGWFTPDSCEVDQHHLELDLRRSVLTRHSRLVDRDGRVAVGDPATLRQPA